MKKLFKILTPFLFTFSLSQGITQDDDGYEHYDNQNQENRQYKFDNKDFKHYDSDDHHDNNRKSSNMFSKKDFGLVLAINSFDKSNDMPDLNTWQSRYVALQWRRNNRLITGRQVDVALGTGLEIAWNNFMMQHDEQYFENGNISYFELLT